MLVEGWERFSLSEPEYFAFQLTWLLILLLHLVGGLRRQEGQFGGDLGRAGRAAEEAAELAQRQTHARHVEGRSSRWLETLRSSSPQPARPWRALGLYGRQRGYWPSLGRLIWKDSSWGKVRENWEGIGLFFWSSTPLIRASQPL